ncbi:MAG: RNA methyltransferase [Dissulfuribacterales bacterium]
MRYIGLVHYPVLNREGELIVSAVTNLDIHDVARAAATYGVTNFFVITPIERQMALTREIIGHWLTGVGGTLNADRKRAMETVRVVSSVEEALAAIKTKHGLAPEVYATTACKHADAVSWRYLRNRMDMEAVPVCLLFGTASGLAMELLGRVNGVLEPIYGVGDYNHLSVRSAVSVALDRLFGCY